METEMANGNGDVLSSMKRILSLVGLVIVIVTALVVPLVKTAELKDEMVKSDAAIKEDSATKNATQDEQIATIQKEIGNLVQTTRETDGKVTEILIQVNKMAGFMEGRRDR